MGTIVDTPQHLVLSPDDLASELAYNASLANATANISGGEVYRVVEPSQIIRHGYGSIVLLGLLVALSLLALILVSYRMGRLSLGYAERVSRVASLYPSWRLGYEYSRMRRVLRSMYEELALRARKRGIVVPKTCTITEFAQKTWRSLGDRVFDFAKLYNRYMYSREEPGEDTISKARRIVDGID